MPEFKRQLKEIGIVLTGQSGDLAPADGKLYALRDVTGTVPSIPLIASSVMSKKIAAGAQAIVLDVKVGSGAFMPALKDATQLARALVSIGRKAGRRTVAVISDMNQPLGHAVGNALELREALDTLRGGGPRDFREHCLLIGGHLLRLAGKARTEKAAWALMEAAWADGRALAKFRQMVEWQGGDVRVLDNPDLLPAATRIETVAAPRTGYVAAIHAGEIGLTAVDLGAGRAKKGDPLDYAVGLMIHRKVGDRVKKGEPLFTIHANDAARLAAAKQRALAAHRFSAARVQPLPLYYKVLQSA
jgi:pyrimidine-nucleoside phosphorylase